MKNICVFCGSSPGSRPAYALAAEALGLEMGRRGHNLVFGGGGVGLMGVVADSVLAAGGEVLGVIPEALFRKDVAHKGLTELRVVESMHERKAAMVEASHAFIALPGGMGTLEELLEVLTWAQLGFHSKPVGILDVGGYFHHLLALLDHGVAQRFLRAEHRDMLISSEDPGELLDQLVAFEPSAVDKWIDGPGGRSLGS